MEKKKAAVPGWNTRIFSAVSFLVDIGSEMIAPLLPFFLVNILFAPVVAIGLIEAVREFTARTIGVFSGLYGDSTGKRKRLVILGYSFSGIMKLFLATATSWTHVLAVVAMERIGKGVREAPRDALLAQDEKKENLGKAFGFRKAADNAGAVLGPMLATLIIAFLLPKGVEFAYRTVFLIALIPSAIAVLLLFFIREKKEKAAVGMNMHDALYKAMENPEYRKFLIAYAVFALGQFSITFFLLRSGEYMGLIFIPIVYMVYNVSSSLFSLPAGYLADRKGAKKSILIAQALFTLCVAGFVFFPSAATIIGFFALAGIFAAINETAPRVFISKKVPKENLASAIGVFDGVVGIAMLAGNIVAGIFYTMELFSAPATFTFSIAISMVSMALMWIMVKE